MASSISSCPLELSMTTHPSDISSILVRVSLRFSRLSNLSSSSPLDSILESAVRSSTSTRILTSGVGRTLSNILYAKAANLSGRYETAMMYLTKITSSYLLWERFMTPTDLTTSRMYRQEDMIRAGMLSTRRSLPSSLPMAMLRFGCSRTSTLLPGLYSGDVVAIVPIWAVCITAGLIAMLSELLCPGRFDNLTNSMTVAVTMCLLGL